MNTDSTTTIAQLLAIIITAVITTLGVTDADNAKTLGGAIATVLVIIWGIYSHRDAAVVKAAARLVPIGVTYQRAVGVKDPIMPTKSMVMVKHGGVWHDPQDPTT